MKKFLKLLLATFVSVFFILGTYNIAQASSHPTWQEIKKIRKEIVALGAEPIKRKGLQGDSKLLRILEKQLKELKEKQKKVEALKEEIKKEIEALGEKPKVDTSDIDDDKEIIALKKQLQDIKNKNKKKKEEAKKKEEESKKAEEKKQNRAKAIQSIKKEILFLGETPISEFEVNNEDEYIAALKKQIEEIKSIKKQEEKDIEQSIPSWFIKMPKGSEKVIYVRGTAVVDTLQGSIDSATNAALRELGKKLETRLNSKVNDIVRQAGMGEDIVTKSEMNRVSSIVVKEVTISGFEVADTKMVKLDNGSYRSFILLEYPVAQVNKAFINRIERESKLRKNLSVIKDTEAFKELEEMVAEFTGA